MTLLLLASMSFIGNAQCDGFEADFAGSICNNNGTPNDPTDDTFTAFLNTNNDNSPSNTWSSSDGTYINEPFQDGAVFGPYDANGGDVSIDVRESQTGCLITNITLEVPNNCPQSSCPDFDLCYVFESSDGCCVTHTVQFSGSGMGLNEMINLTSFRFDANNGFVESVEFMQNSVALPVSLDIVGENVNSNVNPITWGELTNSNEGFLVTVCGETGDQISPVDNFFSIIVGNTQFCPVNNNWCVGPWPYTVTGGVDVFGSIYANGLYDCPNTINHGIEGAEVSITSASGNSCETTTDNAGDFACNVCGEGPYEVCVTTQCDEPCGITMLDLILLEEYINGFGPDPNRDLEIIGDLNNDGSVSGWDVTMLRQELFEIDTDRVDNWCRFVEVNAYGNLTPPDGTNTSDYEALDSCTMVNDPSVGVEFIRFMKGDMDYSCSDCVHNDGIGNTPIKPGRNLRDITQYRSTTNEKIHALTFVFEIPKRERIVEVKSSLPKIKHAVVGNELRVVWIDESDSNIGHAVRVDDVLISVKTSQGQILPLAKEGNYMLTDAGASQLTTAGNRSMEKELTVNVGNIQQVNINAATSNLELNLYDIVGRRIHTQTVNDINNFIPFNTNGTSGMYILNTYDGFESKSYKIYLNNGF